MTQTNADSSILEEQPDASAPTIGTFQGVISAFHTARAEIAGLFAVVGVDPTKARESARELGINRGLSWRLTRMVRESNPAAAASDVPGTQSMAKFFDACRERGASKEALESAAQAVERFELALSRCSGDRKTFAMLLANGGAPRNSNNQERARRKVFEGACGVWGVQAQTRFVTVFVFPSPDDPDQLDAGHVTGFVGCRRLSSRPWPLSYEAVHRSTGDVASFVKEPLHPSGHTEGQAQLFQEFCSPVVPEIEVHEAGGYKRFELAVGPVGNEGLQTVVFGTRLRRLYPRYSETPETAGFMVLITTPVERVLFDLFVHRGLMVPTGIRTQLLDRLMFPHVNDESEYERMSLPLQETAVTLPPGVSGAMCPHIPWYTQMVTSVTSRLGMSINDFTGSRFEMAYPPISTTLSRRFDLLPHPR